MSKTSAVALGLDFGTESVRALLVTLAGDEVGSAVARYAHGQITECLPGTEEALPAEFALQHPSDWLDSASVAVAEALAQAKLDPSAVLSIGVDFTSCTMLPSLADGTPLCLVPGLAADKHAWPKLWKHHAAQSQTDRLNLVARERHEPWLARYGGAIGLEWFFPKILEVLERAPRIYQKAEVWLEAGDWFVWQLVGGPAAQLPRSTCQAGYKAMWNHRTGFPSPDYFAAVAPKLRDVAQKLPGRFLAPGQAAGELCATAAARLGLPPGLPVSAAAIDAHAGVPGAGVAEPGTLVMVLGTSSCHMLNALDEQLLPGLAGVVDGGILSGMFGYETGQAAVGDAFDWCRRLTGGGDFQSLNSLAAALPPGADGVRALDWMNGCRTPLMDGNLKGAFTGLALRHGPEHIYRALLEASAFGLRWIVELFREGGLPVKRLVATGGLPHHNPLLVSIYADVLQEPILVHPCLHGPALGAAILGVLAAGRARSGFASATAAVRAMAQPRSDKPSRTAVTVKPNRKHQAAYDRLYLEYRQLAEQFRERANPPADPPPRAAPARKPSPAAAARGR